MELLSAGRVVSAIALHVAASSCDPIIDGGYRGAPVFSFEGQIVQFEAVGDAGPELRTTLLWLTDLSPDPVSGGPRLASGVEQRSAAVEVRFPAQFRVDLFVPPDAHMLVPGTGIGVALIIVYEDRDGDDRLTLGSSPPELVGGAPYEVLVFAKDAASARDAPFLDAIARGFQLVRLPLFCGDEGELVEWAIPDDPSSSDAPPRSSGQPPCSVELGAPCTFDAECAEGQCLVRQYGETFRGGYCVLAIEDAAAAACEPAQGVSIAWDFHPDGRETHWFRRCVSDRECRRGDGYTCDPWWGACVPVSPVALELGPGYEPVAICYELSNLHAP